MTKTTILNYLIVVILTACANSEKEQSLISENQEINLTKFKTEATSSSKNSPSGETVDKLIDGDKSSKFLCFNNKTEVVIKLAKSAIIKKLMLTSGNDAPERDPKSFKLLGSNEKNSWTLITESKNVGFKKRNETIEISVNNQKTFKFYKFNFANTNGKTFQLSEIELIGLWDLNDKKPIADFKADNKAFFNEGKVKLQNLSVSGKKFKWVFEGGTPSSSTEMNPIITYNKRGKFDIQLIAYNSGHSDTIKFNDYINVKKIGAWNEFVFPKIHYVNESEEGNGKIFDELVPDPQAMIKKVCLDVSKIMYKSVDEVDVLQDFDYIIKDMKGVAYKDGMPPHIKVVFSSQYLKDKREKMTDKELIFEIEGVLYHEITHGYQYSPSGCGGYVHGNDHYSLVEGIADYVRYKSGYFKDRSPKLGGSWKDGYCTTGFFIEWMEQKDKDILYKLNQSAKTIVPWSWNKALNNIIGKPVKTLWNEYQNYLKTK
jgi:PKD repeat protein